VPSRRTELLKGVEEWEFPLRRGDALRAERDLRVDRGRALGRGGVPAGAVAELEDAIGEVLPFGLLVLPQSLRGWGRGWRTRVCTPAQVVALSEWGVALWVDVLGVRDWIPLQELAVIDNQRLPEHGRLVLRGPRHRVTVRYPAEATGAVSEFTAAVRSLVTGRAKPVPDPRLPTGTSLRRWRDVLDDKGCADVDFAAVETRLPGWWRRRWARRALVGVTPQEVVVAVAPSGGPGQPPEMIYVPRSRLTRLTCAGRALRVEAHGLCVDVVMGRRHAQQVVRRLGPGTPGRPADAEQNPSTTPGQPPVGP
jgi:hypothetical protein